jgi:hypothetical protein
MNNNRSLIILSIIAAVLAVGFMFAMFRGEPFKNFEMSRLYFAAGTLAVLAFLFLMSMIFYVFGPETSEGEAPGKAVFDACVKVIPPIVTLIIGFYFGAYERGLNPVSNEQANAAPTTTAPSLSASQPR